MIGGVKDYTNSPTGTDLVSSFIFLRMSGPEYGQMSGACDREEVQVNFY